VVGEKAHGHLGAAGVVHAQEQHGGFAVVGQAFDLGQCVEALAGEAFGQKRQEVGHGGAAGELVVEECKNRSMVSALKVPSKSRASLVAAWVSATCWSRVMSRRR
jgi:hypothetical protein